MIEIIFMMSQCALYVYAWRQMYNNKQSWIFKSYCNFLWVNLFVLLFFIIWIFIHYHVVVAISIIDFIFNVFNTITLCPIRCVNGLVLLSFLWLDNPFYSWVYAITVTRDGVSNHQPRDCLLNRLVGADKRKQQNSASLAFVWGIHLHRWPVNSPHKSPVMRKMFPFDDVIMHWPCEYQNATKGIMKDIFQFAYQQAI